MNRRESIKCLLATIVAAISHQSKAMERGAKASIEGSKGSSARLSAGLESSVAPAFEWLRLGAVKPKGWIQEQMLRDLKTGSAGRLDELCHQASTDIFANGRKTFADTHVTNKDGEVKPRPYWWWDGETQGNWRSGFIKLAYLSGDKQSMQNADAFVQHVLSFQGDDGYLGACDKDVRYQFPGELWTQACLLRGLIAYGEITQNDSVLAAVRRAVDATMAAYRGGNGKQTWKQSHDILIADVLEQLFDLTGEVKYKDFGVWLYEDWSNTKDGMAGIDDDKLANLLDSELPFKGHCAHVVEGMRAPLWLWTVTGRDDLGTATRNAFAKLERYAMPGGSVVSSGLRAEFIDDQPPDPNKVEFEYCTTKETLDTYMSAMQKMGAIEHAERVERIFFNDAQGSRLPDGSGLGYFSIDNCSHCDGLTPDGSKPQKRNKYSPTHDDVAVCCNPNSANLAPNYVRGMWMRHPEGGLAALLYGPCTLTTTVGGVSVKLEEKTNYPFEHTVEVAVQPERKSLFSLYFRDPQWSQRTKLECDGAHIERTGDFWKVSKSWKPGDRISLTFVAKVQPVTAVNGEVALKYGALLYALPISSTKKVVKTYSVTGFEDTHYEPGHDIADQLALVGGSRENGFGFKPGEKARKDAGLRPFDSPMVSLRGEMVNKTTGVKSTVELIPLGCTILRRLTFPVHS
jgi:uncharacterized protein